MNIYLLDGILYNIKSEEGAVVKCSKQFIKHFYDD
jgi:hypothetical protein